MAVGQGALQLIDPAERLRLAIPGVFAIGRENGIHRHPA